LFAFAASNNTSMLLTNRSTSFIDLGVKVGVVRVGVRVGVTVTVSD
jgi:hypothetical protein